MHLCDRDNDGVLNKPEFPLLMLCIQQARNGGALPQGPFTDHQVTRLLGPGALLAEPPSLSPAMRDLLGLGFSLEQAKV